MIGKQRTLKSVSRRSFLTSASLATVALSSEKIFGTQTLPAAASPTLVRTPLGILRGELSGDVRIFRGVRFVEPPVGPLRFRPPVKIKPWEGERDATKFVASPMQTGEPGVQHSEDCLGLNLWAPAGDGPYPVFVWIHGGGYTGGHAFDAVMNGAEFAREGIIVVTVPYRLGIFGFLDVGPLVGPGYAGSANNGVRDVIAVLEWVRDNIASFGGDSNRVTLGGESAGGKLTDTLMGVPSAQPLFQQMISSSGGAERIWQKPDAVFASERFGAVWQKTAGHDLTSLLTAPAATLLEAQQSFIAASRDVPNQGPRPQVDGDLLPRLPVETVAAGSTRGKRLLIGSNLDETAISMAGHPNQAPTLANVGNVPLARFNEIYPHYQSIYPHLTEEQRRIRAVSAQAYWIPSIRVADAHLKGGGNAWMYRLDFAETSGRLPGYAFHSLDVGLVWNRPHKDVANAAAEAVLSRQMHQAWVAFIRGQVPAAPGLPAWPEYRPDTRATMILNTPSTVEERPHEAELRLWDGLL